MKPSELKALIQSRYAAGIRRPLYVESSPGIGKTQIASQCAQELGIAFKAIHAPLLQPEDYGFPVINSERSNVSFIVSSEKFPLQSDKDCPPNGILLIDELSQADNNAQKILANLIQEREIHGQRIRDEWLVIATGNRQSDRAGANRILSHLGNRLTRITLDASIDDWTNWALDRSVSPELVSFIRFRPELLSKFDAAQDINPTPRAWIEGVNASLGKGDSASEFEVFKGDIGEGAAAEFLAFLKIYRKLPNPDAIILDPSGSAVPDDMPTLYALCGALSSKATKVNFSTLMTYVKRMPAEFTVLFVRDSLKRCKEVASTKEFTQWASTEGQAILA